MATNLSQEITPPVGSSVAMIPSSTNPMFRSTKPNSKRAKLECDQSDTRESPTKKTRRRKSTRKSVASASKLKSKKNEPIKNEVLHAEEKETEQEVVIPVDDYYPAKSKVQVVDDFDATLNRSDITNGNNKNKYYRIQMVRGLTTNAKYHVFTRWGRVGEVYEHNTKNLGPFVKFEKARSTFEKKFKDKTSNSWENRANFTHVHGKYDMISVDYTKDADAHLNVPERVSTKNSAVECMPSKLDKNTKELVDMLFDVELYQSAMAEYDFDIRRMPLGQLSTAQIQLGVDVLAEIEDILQNNRSHYQLSQLTSRFYSVLPHDFGRRRPPIINNMDILQKAFDKCNVLLDIEKANQMMEAAEKDNQTQVQKQLLPNPTDARYNSLGADLTLVDKDSAEYEKVLKAFQNTASYGHTKLINVWRVNRHGEDKRFAPFADIDNKKCLWHGTNIAVVAAILSSGLRIMPHSGGRVGKGIYLASECGKSQGYTSPSYSRQIGCMFLAEAALGNEFDLLHDDSSLVKAPNGFDSVVARGHQTPAKSESISLDGHDVLIPTGKPKRVKKYEMSSFSQDEYLVYREEQVRLRYIISVGYSSNYY